MNKEHYGVDLGLPDGTNVRFSETGEHPPIIMNNEIKEILDNLKYTAKKHTIQVLEDGGKIEHCPQEIATELRLNTYSANILLDYITNLQEELKSANESITWWTNRFKAVEAEIKKLKEENERLSVELNKNMIERNNYLSRNEKAIEYITSYEAISTIQGLNKIEQNKKLDERTMNVMVERYLKVHHNLLNILQGEDKDE